MTIWKTEAGETARVSTGKLLAYVRRSRAIGGIILNPGDERHSLAIAKFFWNERSCDAIDLRKGVRHDLQQYPPSQC